MRNGRVALSRGAAGWLLWLLALQPSKAMIGRRRERSPRMSKPFLFRPPAALPPRAAEFNPPST
jgi:hypothetical protein